MTRVRRLPVVSDRERTMLAARYDDAGKIRQSYTQLGPLFGVTPGRVQQIVSGAERKLRYIARHGAQEGGGQ